MAKKAAEKETAKKAKTVAKKRPLKAVAAKQAKAAAPAVLSVDDNLKKLAASRLPMNFVRAHNGNWDHELWLQFLEEVKAKGYDPIDQDRVGLILEEAKTKFFAKKA